ncbi:sensor domain-containing protein [Streptomyces sp. P1-3]|uniref:sensor domain-containing protein n=1 Tax=Streptomyces sp. P1-3 TaxID=3421658 RepID=UPI003D36A0CE
MTQMTSPLPPPRAYEPTAHGAGDFGRVGRVGHVSRLGRFGRELGYLLAGLPVGVAAFVIAVTGFSVGAASLVVLLGLPVLVAALAAARAFAGVERRHVEAATGRALPAHYYRPRDGGGAGLAGWLRALRDPQSWRDLTHMLVAFPLRVTTFCIAVTWTVGGLGELLYGAWSWSVPRDEESGLLDLMFGIDSRLADIAFNTGIGVVLLATAVPVVRGLAAIQAALARGLLTNPSAARTR